jgi:beta-1,4-mannooligosaccharide/beta-1,4-mannosyl-N-acetylglucosamine phosphorylase
MELNSNHELFHRYSGNPILSVSDWPYKANSVFNAAAAEVNGKTILLARVEDFRGMSHLTVARSDDGINNWEVDKAPGLKPEPEKYPEELWGIEDPRITWIEELKKWAICYTAYSKGGPLVSLAMTGDFKTFERFGPVMPPEDKDAALFPVKFNGLWAMLHRPVPKSKILGAHIWVSFSPNLKHWGEHQEIIQAREGGWWDANKIGLCAPPMQTKEGWLILYHGVRTTASGSIYRLGLALLDLENPAKVIRRTDEWIFGPKAHYEREGDVDDVVFPCGWIKKKDKVFIYYGAADSRICLATADFNELVDFVLRCPDHSNDSDLPKI